MKTSRYFFLAFFAIIFLFSNIYGQGIKASFNPAARNFTSFGNVTVGKTKEATIIIHRTDTTAGALNVVLTAPATAAYSIIGATSFSLGIDQRDTITVRFQPLTVGAAAPDTLFISHNADTSFNLKNPVVYILRGTGVAQDTAPKISVTVGSGGFGTFINFGSVTIGKSVQRTVTVKNISDTARTLTGSIEAPVTHHYSIVSGSPFTLDSGKSAIVTLEFHPDSAATILADSIFVLSNATAPNNRIKVTLTGSSTKASSLPKITVTGGGFGGTINMGRDTVGLPPKTAMITITNTSDSARTLIGNVASVNSPFSILSGSGAFSLDSGKSLTVQVAFKALISGSFRDSLVITSNSDSANQLKKVYLTGTGVSISAGPRIRVQPISLDFGKAGPGDPAVMRTLTITNISDSLTDTLRGTLTIGSGSFVITSGGTSFTLVRNDSVKVTISMQTNMVKNVMDSLIINSNTGDNSKHIAVLLTGIVDLVGAVKQTNSPQIHLTVNPNPVTEKTLISFSLDNASSGSMKIFDISGKEIFSSDKHYEEGINRIEWNANGFEAGSYLCIVKVGELTSQARIILTK
jgi:hypothetical protein